MELIIKRVLELLPRRFCSLCKICHMKSCIGRRNKVFMKEASLGVWVQIVGITLVYTCFSFHYNRTFNFCCLTTTFCVDTTTTNFQIFRTITVDYQELNLGKHLVQTHLLQHKTYVWFQSSFSTFSKVYLVWIIGPWQVKVWLKQ